MFDLAAFRQFLQPDLIEKADYTGCSRYARRRAPAVAAYSRSFIDVFELATSQQFLQTDLIESADSICLSRFARGRALALTLILSLRFWLLVLGRILLMRRR